MIVCLSTVLCSFCIILSMLLSLDDEARFSCVLGLFCSVLSCLLVSANLRARFGLLFYVVGNRTLRMILC